MAVKEASNVSTESAHAHAKAEEICKPQFHGWSTAYMNCFLAELAKFPTSSQLPDPVMPPPANFRYSFVSPKWSPDFAGWSVVITLVIALIIALRLISLVALRLLLKRHYQQI